MNTIIKNIMSSLMVSLALLVVSSTPVSAATNQARYEAVDQAIAFITAQQAADGSLSNGVDDEGELAAIALSAAGIDIATIETNGVSLLDYFVATKDLDTVNASYTYNLVQRMLALSAAGYDTRSFAGVNYEELLLNSYASSAIQNSATIYDDSFGLLLLIGLNNPSLDGYIQSAVDALGSLAQSDGGFCPATPCLTSQWSPTGTDIDSTSFAYVALGLAMNEGYGLSDTTKSLPNVVAGASAYIDANYDSASGLYNYGSISSTGIVAMTFNSMGRDTTAIVDSLLQQNRENGGFGYGYNGVFYANNYDTIYATLALLGTNWLLNPEPIDRPQVVETPDEDTVTDGETTTDTSVAAAVESAVVRTASTFSPLSPSQLATFQSLGIVEGAATGPETSVLIEEDATTTADNSGETTEDKALSLGMKIGYGLVGIAVVGLAGYGLLWYRRRG